MPLPSNRLFGLNLNLSATLKTFFQNMPGTLIDWTEGRRFVKKCATSKSCQDGKAEQDGTAVEDI